MTRDDILKSMFRIDGRGLEIGPSYNPLLPKAQGFNVEVLDHASQSELIEKYRDEKSVDCTRIEHVDHVCDSRPFTETIGARGRYDFVVASHVIEHSPDVVSFLRDCEDLLRPDGVLVLAVPDKRYCFDVMRPVSTSGTALQAFHERRTRHQPGVIFDHMSSFAQRGGISGWHVGDRRPLELSHGLDVAKVHFDAGLTRTGYTDMHAWCFTPSSFRLMVRDFNELGLFGLKEQAFRTTEWFEFFVVLSRDGAGCTTSRLDLLKAVAAELSAATAEVMELKDELEALKNRPQ
jgi:predicted SAM-dependent methyltransferase